jgi:hypothetical protein
MKIKKLQTEVDQDQEKSGPKGIRTAGAEDGFERHHPVPKKNRISEFVEIEGRAVR